MAYSDEVLADLPLAYYRLDEASGTSMLDSSGNARHGTYPGAVTLGQPPLILEGTSAEFAASGGGSVADAAWMDVTRLTVEAWIRADALGFPNSFGVVSRGFPPYYTSVNDSAKFFGGVSTTVTQETLTGGTTLVVGEIYHLAMTYDGAALRLYVNGAQDASLALTGDIVASSAPLLVGKDPGSGKVIDGRMDEVAIYDHALSAARVLAHYEAGLSSVITGTLSLTLPAIEPQFQASSSAAGTDTFNRTNGRTRSGTGWANQDEPVAAVPATVSREPIRVMAQTLPTPTLEDGRPV